MNKKIIILGVVVLVVLGGVLIFGNSRNIDQPVVQETMETTEHPTEMMTEDPDSTGSMQQSAVKEFVVESEGLRFTTDEITVNSGDTVKITYKNTVGKHDWVIDEFDAKTELISAGEEETVEFVADKAGNFEFYCSVPGHREAGMKGTLIVK